MESFRKHVILMDWHRMGRRLSALQPWIQIQPLQQWQWLTVVVPQFYSFVRSWIGCVHQRHSAWWRLNQHHVMPLVWTELSSSTC